MLTEGEFHVMYEVPEGGGGADPAPPAGDPPAGDPPAGDPPSAWAPPQEEWQNVTRFIEQAGPTLGMLGELMQEPEPQYQPPAIDPADPNSVSSYVDSQVQRLFEERMAPFQPLLGQIAEREGEQAARTRLDELAGTVGNFDRDQALVAAQVLLTQGLQPDQALEQAARRQFQFEEGFRNQAIEAYKTSLTAAATATPGAPPGGSAANESPAPDRGKDRYELALERGMSRLHPVNESNFG